MYVYIYICAYIRVCTYIYIYIHITQNRLYRCFCFPRSVVCCVDETLKKMARLRRVCYGTPVRNPAHCPRDFQLPPALGWKGKLTGNPWFFYPPASRGFVSCSTLHPKLEGYDRIFELHDLQIGDDVIAALAVAPK